MTDQKDKFLNDIKKKKSKDKSDKKHNNTTQERNTKTQHNKYTIAKKEKTTGSKKLRRNFYISAETDNYLNKISKKTNRSKSELVETAIEIMKQEADIK